MKSRDEILEALKRVPHEVLSESSDGMSLRLWRDTTVVVVWGGDWDHVSVSCKSRTPTWTLMCSLKRVFFREDEWAIQYHPAAKDAVDTHPHPLHLWRPHQPEYMQLPPIWMV